MITLNGRSILSTAVVVVAFVDDVVVVVVDVVVAFKENVEDDPSSV